jgi:hypothetical protein
MGSRISDMRLISTGEPLEADKKYTVGGWASVNENVEGPAIYDLMEKHITEKKGGEDAGPVHCHRENVGRQGFHIHIKECIVTFIW